MGCDNLDNAENHPGGAQSGSSSAKREFSNDWKIFFQWLEKMAGFFQRLENFFCGFQMIGKIFQDVFWKQKGQRGEQNKGRTRDVRQL